MRNQTINYAECLKSLSAICQSLNLRSIELSGSDYDKVEQILHTLENDYINPNKDLIKSLLSLNPSAADSSEINVRDICIKVFLTENTLLGAETNFFFKIRQLLTERNLLEPTIHTFNLLGKANKVMFNNDWNAIWQEFLVKGYCKEGAIGKLSELSTNIEISEKDFSHRVMADAILHICLIGARNLKMMPSYEIHAVNFYRYLYGVDEHAIDNELQHIIIDLLIAFFSNNKMQLTMERRIYYYNLLNQIRPESSFAGEGSNNLERLIIFVLANIKSGTYSCQVDFINKLFDLIRFNITFPVKSLKDYICQEVYSLLQSHLDTCLSNNYIKSDYIILSEKVRVISANLGFKIDMGSLAFVQIKDDSSEVFLDINQMINYIFLGILNSRMPTLLEGIGWRVIFNENSLPELKDDSGQEKHIDQTDYNLIILSYYRVVSAKYNIKVCQSELKMEDFEKHLPSKISQFDSSAVFDRLTDGTAEILKQFYCPRYVIMALYYDARMNELYDYFKSFVRSANPNKHLDLYILGLVTRELLGFDRLDIKEIESCSAKIVLANPDLIEYFARYRGLINELKIFINEFSDGQIYNFCYYIRNTSISYSIKELAPVLRQSVKDCLLKSYHSSNVLLLDTLPTDFVKARIKDRSLDFLDDFWQKINVESLEYSGINIGAGFINHNLCDLQSQVSFNSILGKIMNFVKDKKSYFKVKADFLIEFLYSDVHKNKDVFLNCIRRCSLVSILRCKNGIFRLRLDNIFTAEEKKLVSYMFGFMNIGELDILDGNLHASIQDPYFDEMKSYFFLDANTMLINKNLCQKIFNYLQNFISQKNFSPEKKNQLFLHVLNILSNEIPICIRNLLVGCMVKFPINKDCATKAAELNLFPISGSSFNAAEPSASSSSGFKRKHEQ